MCIHGMYLYTNKRKHTYSKPAGSLPLFPITCPGLRHALHTLFPTWNHLYCNNALLKVALGFTLSMSSQLFSKVYLRQANKQTR